MPRHGVPRLLVPVRREGLLVVHQHVGPPMVVAQIDGHVGHRLRTRRPLVYAARLALLVALLIVIHDHDYGAAFALTLVIGVWALLDVVVWILRDSRIAR
jgi:hypothetical protein